MDRETFEDSIRSKFEGQTIKSPAGIWDKIEGANNIDLIALYSKKEARYKWMSIAAILIAVVTLGAQYFKLEDSTPEMTSYNALLSGNYNNQTLFSPKFSGSDISVSTFTAKDDDERRESIVRPIESYHEDANLSPYENIAFIAIVKPSPEIASVEYDIYRYYTLGTTLKKKKNSSKSRPKMWAGLEAGAGSFGSEFNNSDAMANSISSSGLAAAVGTGNFTNPTTNISQSMEDGLAKTVGFDFGVQLGERWTIESGLAYTSMDNRGSASINVLDVYTINNTEFVNRSGALGSDDGLALMSHSREGELIEIEEHYDHEVELNNSVQLASAPLKAGYFVVNKKFSLRLNAGLSANYLVSGSISDPTREIINSDEFNLYNDWSFDGIGGLEFGYSIFNKVDLTVEPNYRHAIRPISNSANTPSRFLIQTGLRYTLR